MTEDAQKILYLGLEPPQENPNVVHFPVIQINPRSCHSHDIKQAFSNILEYTHFIFTSKTAVRIFYQLVKQFEIDEKKINQTSIIAVGQSTAQSIKTYGKKNADYIAKQECAEGIIDILKTIKLEQTHFFWPHSSGARNVITNFFIENKIALTECLLYDTIPIQMTSLPSLESFNEIIFTSPSTVSSFVNLFGKIPKDKKLTCIGPVTQSYLNQALIDS